MPDLIDQCRDLVARHCAGTGRWETPVSGLALYRCDAPTAPARTVYNPRLCVVLQGGKEIAVGALEDQFYAELLERIDAPAWLREQRMDKARWPEQAEAFAALFAMRTRDEWCALLEGTDACFAPVLTIGEAPRHPHMAARQVYVERDGRAHVAPAPRFSRTPSGINEGGDAEELLKRWGAV